MKHLQSKAEARTEEYQRQTGLLALTSPESRSLGWGGREEGGAVWTEYGCLFSQKSGNFGGSLDRKEAEFSFKLKNKWRSSRLVIKRGEYEMAKY